MTLMYKSRNLMDSVPFVQLVNPNTVAKFNALINEKLRIYLRKM